MSISPSPSSLLSSTRKSSPACRVLFPDAVAKAGPPSPCSAEMRLRPQLMPRKRPASAPLPPVEAPEPQLPSTSQPLQQLQPEQQAPPTLQQAPQPHDPLPSFSSSFTSLLYNPMMPAWPQPASWAQPLYVQTDYSYFPAPSYFPVPVAGGYAPVLCIDGYPPAPVAAAGSSCFYTPEPYGPPVAKRGCF